MEKHFYERTINMLKNIENLENNNIKNKIKQIIESVIKNAFQVKNKILFIAIR